MENKKNNVDIYQPVQIDCNLLDVPPKLGDIVRYHLTSADDLSLDRVFKRQYDLFNSMRSYFASGDDYCNNVLTVDCWRNSGVNFVKYCCLTFVSRSVLDVPHEHDDDLFLEDRLKNMYEALPSFVKRKCENGKYKDTFAKYRQQELDFHGK